MVVCSQSEIEELLRKRDLISLREMLKNLSPWALVLVKTGLSTEDQLIVLRILPRELAAEAFESLDLPGKNGC
jgi:Mg/Co/Ni transporter MgtE